MSESDRKFDEYCDWIRAWLGFERVDQMPEGCLDLIRRAWSEKRNRYYVAEDLKRRLALV